MIVMKFGGTSVQDSAAMDRTLSIAETRLPRAPVLIASAMAKVTDQLQLIARLVGEGKRAECDAALASLEERHAGCARAFLASPHLDGCLSDLSAIFAELRALTSALTMLKEWSSRSNDAILSFGERLSTTILLHRARSRGMDADLFDARELVKTDDTFTAALPIDDLTAAAITARVKPRPGSLAITQGFIASTVGGATTTLGRGGSDYSATIFGAALKAEEVEIWTDVNGIMTADPRIVTSARPITAISYREAAELAYFGAKVIHPSTIQPAVALGIPVRVKNTFEPDHPGTEIVPSVPGTGVRAIASKRRITLVSVSSSRMLLAHGFLRRIFEIFEKHQTSVDLIATSEVSVSVTIDNPAAIDRIARDLSEIGTVGIEAEKSIVCLVGQDLWKDTVFLSRVFRSLHDVPVRMISLGASDINLSLVVPEPATEESVRSLHAEFFP
jgi:aspartate kinase